MALINTSLQQFPRAPAQGLSPDGLSAQLNTDFAALLANDIGLEAEIQGNLAAIKALQAAKSGMVGSYVQPSGGPTYGTAASLWNTVAIASSIVGAANSCNGTILGCAPTGQQTSGGLPILLVVAINTSGNTIFTTFSVNAQTGAIAQLAAYAPGTAAGAATIDMETIGGGVVRMHARAASQSVDVTVSAAGAVTLASLNGTQPAFDAGSPVENRAQAVNNVAPQCGNGSALEFGWLTTELTPFARLQPRAVQGSYPSASAMIGRRLSDFVATATTCPIGWASIGNGFFLVCSYGKYASESARTHLMLVYADDNDVAVLSRFSHNSQPTKVQVIAWSTSLAFVKVYGSSSSFVIPVLIDQTNKVASFGMSAANQSNNYVSSGGFGLTMADFVQFSATQGVMLTAEAATDTWGARPVAYDTTQNSNPALAETGAAVPTFTWGGSADTTGNAVILFAVRIATDAILLVGYTSSGGSTASALLLRTLQLTKQ